MTLYKAYIINGEVVSFELINKNTYDGFKSLIQWYISNGGFHIEYRKKDIVLYIDFDYTFVPFNPSTIELIGYKDKILNLQKTKKRNKNIEKLL